MTILSKESLYRRNENWLVVAQLDLSIYDGQRTHMLEFVSSLSQYVAVTFVNLTANLDPISPQYEFITPNRYQIRIPVISNLVVLGLCVCRTVRTKHYKVMYIRACGHYPDMAALLCAKWHGVPTVLEINGAFREQQQIALRSLTGWNRWRGSLSFQMADLIQRWAFRLADQVVVVTDSLKNYMVEQYNVSEERVRVFSNGVNVEKFTPKNKTECKHTLGLRDNKKYIGFVGNLAPWQGVDHLLKAFGLLLHETADCHLLIVGDGAERFKLEVMAERLNINDYVTFTGFVPYTTVVEYINACEFCVAPLQLQQRNQLTGVSPLKVFEYLACAKPVVASNLPDMRFISDHNVGLLCDPANDRSLANHLATLLQLSASELHEMGMRARSLAVNNYSWDVIVDKIVAST